MNIHAVWLPTAMQHLLVMEPAANHRVMPMHRGYEVDSGPSSRIDCARCIGGNEPSGIDGGEHLLATMFSLEG